MDESVPTATSEAGPGALIERDRAWLDGLYDLNRVIAAVGEPLAGSLFYDHHDAGFATEPPAEFNRPKRERFAAACRRATTLLEIGVNGGHSAYLALTANPDLVFHGVDICDHGYVRPAVQWLEARFPGRVRFTPGSCLDVLPRLDGRYDLFHVDGGKHTYYRDVLNCHRLAAPGALLVLDDVNMAPAQRVWERCIAERVITPLAEFPPLPPTVSHRNAVGALTQRRGVGLLRARARARHEARRLRRRLQAR